MMFNNKKGMEQIWWIIAVALIAIVVVMIVLLWFNKSGGRAFDQVDDKIGALGDCDGDNVADMFDKCPCKPGVSKFKGCDSEGEVVPCEEPQKSNCKKCGKLNCPPGS